MKGCCWQCRLGRACHLAAKSNHEGTPGAIYVRTEIICNLNRAAARLLNSSLFFLSTVVAQVTKAVELQHRPVQAFPSGARAGPPGMKRRPAMVGWRHGAVRSHDFLIALKLQTRDRRHSPHIVKAVAAADGALAGLALRASPRERAAMPVRFTASPCGRLGPSGRCFSRIPHTHARSTPSQHVLHDGCARKTSTAQAAKRNRGLGARGARSSIRVLAECHHSYSRPSGAALRAPCARPPRRHCRVGPTSQHASVTAITAITSRHWAVPKPVHGCNISPLKKPSRGAA